MFVVHQSNRTEELIDALAEVLAEPLPDPLQPEIIAVQSLGMRTWLSQQLARRLGIWANADFPFPRALIGQIAGQVLGGDFPAPEQDPYAPQAMTWAILAVLPELLDDPACEPLRRYLTREARELKTFQLARRIASVFDQYCLYRRDWVIEWDERQGDHWQARLFRRISKRLGADHQAGILQRLIERMRGAFDTGDLPARLSVFGISSLPPDYLQVLTGLGQRLDVHLYLLNPCREYWSDLIGADGIARHAEQAGLSETQAAEHLHLDAGHPLLSSLGRQGQDMLRLIEHHAPEAAVDERFVDPRTLGPESALTRLQAHILTLQGPDSGGSRAPLATGDPSVSVHACHAPIREVEVLHDQLRALFEADSGLMPDDVLVMSPDIETYAPLVEAVFAGGHDGAAPIPFGISDRRQRSEARVVESFLALLELLGGRFGLEQVFDLLAVAPVRERFGLGPDELELACRWAYESGIRWGLDADHKGSIGQPAIEQNTWRFGLDRMLLGYAMPAGERRLFAGCLAFDEIEGLEAATLGKLAAFFQVLERTRRSLTRPRPVERWREDLTAVLADLAVEDADSHHEHQLIRDALAGLAEAAARVGHGRPVPLTVLLQALRERLDERRTSLGFLSGGVTFCNLQPMRSLPFRVVCLLGMNEDSFPRLERPLAFDLRSESPRLGDRDSRGDDRYMFLEALLAARDRLIVTYVGRSIRDDGPLPPSVVVSELLDVLQPGVEHAQQDRLHPLQPFSPRYFQAGPAGRDLFSYSQVWCQAAQAAMGRREPAPGFLEDPLPVVAPGREPIPLDELIRFFCGPVRWLLEQRLGLHLRPLADPVGEREPLRLDGLEEHQLGQTLLEAALEAEPSDWTLAAAIQRAAGRLPPGAAGTVVVRTLQGRVEPLAQVARPLLAGALRQPVALDLRLGPERLVGSLRDLRSAGLVTVGYGRLTAKRRLRGWLRHLALAAAPIPEQQRVSVLLGYDKSDEAIQRITLGPLARDPAALLADLVAVFRRGQAAPLLFFPESSLAYAEAMVGQDPEDPAAAKKARKEASKKFRTQRHRGSVPGEGDHPAVRRALGGLDPIGAGPDEQGWGFGQLALRVWAPFLDAAAAGDEP